MTAYRSSRAFRLCVIAAAAQRSAMRHRVGELDNVSGFPLVIRTRRAVCS